MKDFWDTRYSEETYAYGTAPNIFFSTTFKNLNPGKALFPAEGEGRNAVFAASCGWEVVAFDQSEVGNLLDSVAMSCIQPIPLSHTD